MVRSWCDPEEMKRRDRSGPGVPPGSADLDLAVGKKSVRRNRQVRGRGTPPNATGRIILRSVAGAEEAVVIALMGDWNASQMGANADHDQPLAWPVLDPGLIPLRIGKARDRDRAGLIDLLLGAMADIDRLAAPEHLDVLTFGDRRQVDFDRRASGDGRGVRVHLGHQRPDRGQRAYRSRGACCNKED